MKQYKVVNLQIKLNREKTVQELENQLNALAAEGWELKMMDGPMVVFERTK